MFDKVICQLVQTIIGGDDFVILAKQCFKESRLIGVEVSSFNCIGNAIIQIKPRNSQLLATILVYELDSRVVFFGAFEVVARDIVAEDSPSQFIMLEEWGS